MMARRYFISLSCSYVGMVSLELVTWAISDRSLDTTEGWLGSSHKTLERRAAVVSRPASRMLRSSERIVVRSDVVVSSSSRKT
jgi:hypothetical protein